MEHLAPSPGLSMRPPRPPRWPCLRPESFPLISVEVGGTPRQPACVFRTIKQWTHNTCKHTYAHTDMPTRIVKARLRTTWVPSTRGKATDSSGRLGSHREHRTGLHSEEPGASWTSALGTEQTTKWSAHLALRGENKPQTAIGPVSKDRLPSTPRRHTPAQAPTQA